ncbi:MAG: ABC transporter permease subunit [Phyllobacteriaceae bacterium]|nr:ABC transporter permease subunit [Phyllobacteriaceae bacterium]
MTGLASLVPSVAADPSASADLSPFLRRLGCGTGRRLRASAVTPWLLPAGLLALWAATSGTGALPAHVLPAPWAIAAAHDKIVDGSLLADVAVSFRRAVSGLLLGGGIAFALGLANGLSKISERLTDTTVQMVRNIPNLSLIPLVILWFGIGEEAKLFLTALGVFFPVYINTFHGVRTVDAQLLEMGRSYGMGRFDLFRRSVLPGALPSIFVGLRYALGIMWLTLIVAETIAASSGIGHMAMEAREFLRVDVVVLAILIYAGLGKLADVAVRLLERLTLSWHPAFADPRGSK